MEEVSNSLARWVFNLFTCDKGHWRRINFCSLAAEKLEILEKKTRTKKKSTGGKVIFAALSVAEFYRFSLHWRRLRCSGGSSMEK